MKRLGLAASLFAFGATAGIAHADEGMWTLDNLPKQAMQQRYGFTPDQAWIDHVMHASARLALGCSASFVSPDGLVMTNHHCVQGCLGDLAAHSKTDDVVTGYAASRAGAEPRCPGMELDQLRSIGDVTARVDAALHDKSGADYIAAEHAAASRIESECSAGDPSHKRCDVISLYHGGRYALYTYRRYQDVRLAFAPEDAIANFGGDPDNFNYPRFDLDVSFLRVYDGGKPARTDYFAFDQAGPKAGELVFVSGNPGSTSRNETADQIETFRNDELPLIFGEYQNLDGVLWEYNRESAEHRRQALNSEFYVENSLKVFTGWLRTLGNPDLLARKRADDQALLAWIDADPTRKTAYGNPFAAIQATLPAERTLYPRFFMLEGHRAPAAYMARSFVLAQMLVRGAAEREKPDAARLPAYRDANLPELEAQLFSARPVYPELDETSLAFSLTKMRQVLGADDAAVHVALGTQSPDEVAHRLVTGTRVADLATRRALWAGGQKAIASSTDPMIRFALAVDPGSRAVLKQWQDQVEAPQAKETGLIAQARFAKEGNALYPDATFTERLSYGHVAGWTQDGKQVAPFTDFAGLFNRATGAPPFALPASWLAAKPHLDGDTKFDFVSTNDIIGGNSGSPMIDRDAHVIGVAFDGNQASIAGDYIYDGTDNRTVGVDTASMIAALRQVYHLDWLADELTGRKTSAAPNG